MSVIKPEMITKEITRHDVLPLSFLKKTSYTGSKRKLRYKMAKTEIEAETDKNTLGEGEEQPEKKTVLRCYVWDGPFAFDNTPEEEIRIRDFDFNDAGIDAAIDYLNEELLRSESTGA